MTVHPCEESTSWIFLSTMIDPYGAQLINRSLNSVLLADRSVAMYFLYPLVHINGQCILYIECYVTLYVGYCLAILGYNRFLGDFSNLLH